MSKGLTVGAKLPDFERPDQDGVKRRLSELQGDNAMVLLLGRGEHCPRERQHQREMIRFHQWCAVGFTELVTVLPNDLHDVFKLRSSTGAYWTYLSDADLELQRALEIDEYTDPHQRDRPARARARARTGDRQGLRRLLVLGPAVARAALGRPGRAVPADQAGLRSDDTAGAGGVALISVQLAGSVRWWSSAT